MTSVFCGSQREETIAAKKLIQSGSEPTDAKELRDRMSELQSEMFRLEVQRHKLDFMNAKNNHDQDLLTPSSEQFDNKLINGTIADNGSSS